MPLLHNPTEWRLFCFPLQRFLEPDETVRISEEQARSLDGTVFVVEAPSSTPKRETVRRGAKQVEVTRAPRPETRG